MAMTTISARRSGIAGAASWPANRWAGLGGLTFLALVVLQNVLTVTSYPASGATAQQVLVFAQNRAWTVQLLFVTYVIAFPALLAFAGGLSRLAAGRDSRASLPGHIGQYSVVAVVVLFGFVNVAQVTLVAARGDLAGDLALVRTLWILHNTIFTVNFVAVAGALFGLGRAAAISEIVPAWMARVSVAGALALVVSALPIVAEVQSSKFLGLGLAGFLCWLLFLAVASISLVRMPLSPES